MAFRVKRGQFDHFQGSARHPASCFPSSQHRKSQVHDRPLLCSRRHAHHRLIGGTNTCHASDQRFSSWFAICWLCCASRAAAAALDAPSVEDFGHWAYGRVTVLGDYLYMNGGEVSQLVNGEFANWRASDPMNSTISIDLKSSWTTTNAVRRTIAKPEDAPITNWPVLWTDASAGVFYSWGGAYAYGLNIRNNTPQWKFTADGSGSGTWSSEVNTNDVRYTQLHKTELGAVVTINDTMGLNIGGIAHGWTEVDGGPRHAIPGMVAFDMDNKLWQNGTSTFSPFGTGSIASARAEYMPSFGPSGLVVLLGGYQPSTLGSPDAEYALSFFDFRNLTLFDPETKKTYWQTTTGDFPDHPRTEFCTAIVSDSSSGGYEIFIYGGQNGRDNYDYADAYVLSLPGFFWKKLPDSPAGRRSCHDCAAVGKRQVLTVGGLQAHSKGWSHKDPAPLGLQVFDMTKLMWKDNYDAQAAEYVRADDIAQWYSSGSLEKVSWSSPELKGLFVTNGSATSQSKADGDRSSGTPIGAIAGGVAGGVVVLLGIGLAVWLLRRRKSQKPQEAELEASVQPDVNLSPEMRDVQPTAENVKLELEAISSPVSARYPSELSGSSNPYYRDLTATVAELDGGYQQTYQGR